MKRILWMFLALLFVAALFAAYFLFLKPSQSTDRTRKVWQWLRNPQAHAEWATVAGSRCGDAPFQMPTSGFIGYLWGDSWKIGQHHQGIDIFGGTEPGLTPVYAAYDGYLTRLADWKSSVIIRIPSDPLDPKTQIWTYYTHLANEEGNSFIHADFPPGTFELPVKAGTLLGYQGNYSGTPGSPVGVHLHFSIVKDDGGGKYLNELEIGNTLDPSPYFGLGLNSKDGGITPVKCEP